MKFAVPLLCVICVLWFQAEGKSVKDLSTLTSNAQDAKAFLLRGGRQRRSLRHGSGSGSGSGDDGTSCESISEWIDTRTEERSEENELEMAEFDERCPSGIMKIPKSQGGPGKATKKGTKKGTRPGKK